MNFKKPKKAIFNLIWLVLVAALVFGIFKVSGAQNVSEFYDYLKKKAFEFRDFIDPDKPRKIPGIPSEIDGWESTINIDAELVRQSKEKLETITIEEPNSVNYDRTEWKHWISYDRSCWDTREETLYRASDKDKTVLLDKNKEETKDKNAACYIVEGLWTDPYSGIEITEPSKIDIDHLIPLSYAAKHGGQGWNEDKKRAFANDIDTVLIISSAKENRSKGDKGPGAWMPPNKSFHCEYAIRWINISIKYGLSMSKSDKTALEKALNTFK